MVHSRPQTLLQSVLLQLVACFMAAGQGGLVDHGVHAFIVPLRDEAGRCLPGVEIHDCGYKVSASAAGTCRAVDMGHQVLHVSNLLLYNELPCVCV